MFRFFTTFVWNIYHSINSARYDHKCTYVYIEKYSLFLSDFSQTWVFSTDFRNSYKSVQWKSSCSMQTYGQRDTRKLIVTLRNVVNAPKNDRCTVLYTPVELDCHVCCLREHTALNWWCDAIRWCRISCRSHGI